MPNQQKIGEELSILLETVPPNQLRKTIQEIFFGYIISRRGVWPINISRMAEEIYLLIVLLDELEETLS